MAKGGKREGAGRPKGRLNKMTMAQREAAAKSGISPLDYLLSVLRDDAQDPEMRIDAAKAAAPYLHPRLANVEVSGPAQGPLVITWLNAPPK